MNNKEAIRILRLQTKRITPANGELCQALDLAIDALEESLLDIKALKHDLPELFKPHYDGGYLKEGDEE